MSLKVSNEIQALSSEKLYNLSDLAPVRNWNYELPTVTKFKRFQPRVQWQENSTFWKHFSESEYINQSTRSNQWAFLKYIDLKDLAIFGGAITALMTQQDYTINDIDMVFLCDEGSALEKGNKLAERVKKFVTDCMKWMEEKNNTILEKIDQGNRNYSESDLFKLDSNALLVTRYKNCYTIKLACCQKPIQISHCDNLDTLFKGIDIACTAMAFYNGEVIMPEAGKKAIENLAFTIDDTDCSERYLKRVKKYYESGFDVILPKLDIKKLATKNLDFGYNEVLDLPFLTVPYNGLKDNKISATNIEPSKKAVGNASSKLAGYESHSQQNVGQLIHQNICNLVRKKYEEFVYIGEGELYSNAFNSDVVITERMLTNSYETKMSKFFSDGDINFSEIERYLPVKAISVIVTELLVDFAKDKEDGKVFQDEGYEKHVKEYLEKLVEEQITEAKRLIMDLQGKGSLAIVEIAGGETTVSKNDWYGEFVQESDE